jgi:hypothetical protein
MWDESKLRAHPAYCALVPGLDAQLTRSQAEALEPSAQDVLRHLEAVPQRSAVWHWQRQGRVTASKVSAWLGVLEPASARMLRNLNAFTVAPSGDAALEQAYEGCVNGMQQTPPINSHAEGLQRVAMEMGTYGEPTVMLAYLAYLAKWPQRRVAEAGVAHLHQVPTEVAAHGAVNMSALPPIMVSPDGYVVRGAVQRRWCLQLVVHEVQQRAPAWHLLSTALCAHAQEERSEGGDWRRVGRVELKYRCPFVLSKAATGEYYYQDQRCTPREQVPVDHFLQCQLQMLVTGLQWCDLVSYSPTAGMVVHHIERHDRLCWLMLELLQAANETYLVKQRSPRTRVGLRPPCSHPLHEEFLTLLAAKVGVASTCKEAALTGLANPAECKPFVDGTVAEDGHLLKSFLGAHLTW